MAMGGRTDSTSFQAVEDWLRSLGLLHYAQSFYDNGYEDIETCKEIKEADLNVLDIKTERDRQDILNAVSKLQQNLYFELEPERPENIVERSKIESVVLKAKLKECLEREKISLTEPPYYNADGTVGDLYPLAIRYATELATFFDDVMEALDQLRKRQLPVENYNIMAMEKASPLSKEDENRRSLRGTKNLAEYLNCETPEVICKRSSSFSKYDTRVTKSTTDLSKDNIHIPGSPKTKPKRSKNILHVFKRPHRSDRHGVSHQATHEFNASELDISQKEIVDLFKQIKNNELSQDDALDIIKKRGLTKSSSFDGSQNLHLKLIESQSLRLPLEHEPGFDAKSKGYSKSVKSSLKNRTASAQFYTKDDDICRSQASLISTDSKSSLETSGDNSGYLIEEDRQSVSSKNSPESGKHGLLKKIRNSMRKRNKLNEENSEKEIAPSDKSTRTEDDMVLPKLLTNSNKLFFTTMKTDLHAETTPEINVHSSLPNVSSPLTKVVPPPPSTPPPPPPSDSNNDLVNDVLPREEEGFRDRKPSLQIKLYSKYQEESSKRRAVERNNNLPPCTTSMSTNTIATVSIGDIFPTQSVQSKRASAPDTSMFATQHLESKRASASSFDTPSSDFLSELSKPIPRIPPRPAPRKPRSESSDSLWRCSTSSDSNEPSPIVPPRRSKVLRAESTERHIDELGKEMNEIIAGLDNDLHKLNDMSEKTEDAVKESLENTAPKETDLGASNKPVPPTKASTLGWKKPVPPPRPQLQRPKSLTQTSDQNVTLPNIEANKVCEAKELPKQVDIKGKANIREVLSQKRLVKKKLAKEMIDLTASPYSSKEGSWCVPYNLVLRYADELSYSAEDIVKLFEEIRVEERTKKSLPIIGYSEEQLHANKFCDGGTLNEWLIHIGLPMFADDLLEVGIVTINQLKELNDYDINHVGIFEERHVTLLLTKLKMLS